MLARTVVLRKRRPVEFRSTRSPREVLISLPFRQPSDARVSLARTAAPRGIPMQRSRWPAIRRGAVRQDGWRRRCLLICRRRPLLRH